MKFDVSFSPLKRDEKDFYDHITKLIDLIERYELYKFDNIVLKKKNKIYKVRKGDTLYSISDRFNMPVDLLIKMNNLETEEINIGDTLIIKK